MLVLVGFQFPLDLSSVALAKEDPARSRSIPLDPARSRSIFRQIGDNKDAGGTNSTQFA